MSNEKYWIKPGSESRFLGPSWRNLMIPSIIGGGLWYVGWLWAKSGDNKLDWNNFKLHAAEQSRQALGIEDYKKKVGADLPPNQYPIQPQVGSANQSRVNVNIVHRAPNSPTESKQTYISNHFRD